MDRRLFLKRLAQGLVATAATAVLDPEELLWQPGAKTIFLPPEKKLLKAEFIGQHGLFNPSSDLAQQFAKGDIFTVEGWYAINPQTRKKTPHLQQFVVTRPVYQEGFQAMAVMPRLLNQNELLLGGVRTKVVAE